MTETRTCGHCRRSFVVEADDFSFYEKLNVPPPTFCPDCRKQRRLAWRNDSTLYSRACGLCDKNTISIYAPNGPMQIVYCQKCWWSDKWDPKEYGAEYDFSKTFFEQFAELQRRVPALAMTNDDGISSVNSEYTQDFARAKNCYMCFIGWKVEDCLYDFYIIGGKEIVDAINSMGECEYTYETVYTEKCYQSRYIYSSVSVSDSAFCYDCRDCTDCFMCVGLRHKRYCFKNKQYTKEEYEKILADYRLDTYTGVERAKKEFADVFFSKPRRFAMLRNCFNCTGDALINGKNSKYCFNVQRPEETRWVENGDTPKDSYDLSVGGELQQCYEGITPDHSYQSRFAIFSWRNTDVSYVDGCHASEHLFGCAGLKKGQYCIFNRQYPKEEYESLVKKIKAQMDGMPYADRQGISYKFGEFFPAELSYFRYNETVAQESFPLTKEKASAEGLDWQEQFQVTIGKETIDIAKVPDAIADVPDSIVDEVLACAGCARNYRIVPAELKFYRRMRIPLPRRCFYCRQADRLKFKNPHKLWHRQCQCAGEKESGFKNTAAHFHGKNSCPNEFETPYAPESPEIVYCEQCYQAEVV